MIFLAKKEDGDGMVKIGQLRIKTSNKSNPFRNYRIDTIRVIAIKDNYVQYYNYTYKDTDDESLHDVGNMELIKENKASL